MLYPSYQKPLLGTPLKREHPLAKGLVGCWIFNEAGGSKVYDLSGNNNTGTLTNMAFPSTATSGWHPGRTGQALKFDGVNDYVDVGNGMGKPANYTLSFWVKPSAWGNAGIAGSGTGEDKTTWGMVFRDIGDQVEVWTSNGTSGQQGIVETNWNSTGFPLNSWAHIVATVDGNNIKYYKNGILINTIAQTVQMAGTVYKFSIGRLGEYAGGYYFNGLIDEPLIYNRALSADEVKQLYQSPYAMFQEDPIWWMAQQAAVTGQPTMRRWGGIPGMNTLTGRRGW